MKSGKLQKKMTQRSTLLRKSSTKSKINMALIRTFFEHLDHVLHLALEPVEDSECGDLIREGLNLLKNRNKHREVL